ncbi:DUF368 domain-containing protein [Lachnospiraceae bacterium OttesenSCG-928-D06]|nr:DUF368 domain-containing protein [Lachnospiraceae bacterium OttesenSCG-928-D06]
MQNWILRFIKGMFIGSGFILPGVSGGALAAVFGIYERIISFLAHITKDFKKNVLFFIPVAFGGMTGVYLLAFGVSFVLENYESYVLWMFIGCIIGTLPALWEQAGKKGREKKHYIILLGTFLISLLFLLYGASLFSEGFSPGFGSFLFAGVLIGLGMIVPGLSPSNFLVYMGLYKPLTDGIKTLDFMVIIPIGVGAIICVLLLSKVMDYIFRKAYAGLFHFILGVVFASTIMIIPKDFNYFSYGSIICLLMCFVGMGVGYFMSALEKKYK